MRILHVNSASSFAGGERHTLDLVRVLSERGHELYVATRPHSPLHDELAELLPAENLIELPLRNALDLSSARELARFIAAHKIEIVHAHVARDYLPVAYAVRRARSSSARLIITRHLLFPLNRLHALALRRRAARVIAVSAGVARVLSEQGIIPAHKIRVVLNGVDTNVYTPPIHAGARAEHRHQIAPSSDAALLVGIAGELRPHKGQDDFVRAAARVAPQFPKVDFLIAGEDPTNTKEFRAHLERLIEELDLSGRVHLTGWLPNVGGFFAALDVFVSASRVEPFGLVIVEAMASGAAVISTATDGAREIIDDNRTGKLIPIGDVETMAAAISELLTDVDMRAQFRERALIVVRERFSLERMVDETEQIYRESLEEML